MLAELASFPHAGSTGFLRGTAQRVTIVQHNADGSCTVALQPPRFMSAQERFDWARRGASRTRRVDAADLYETELLATFCGKPPKGRAARGRR